MKIQNDFKYFIAFPSLCLLNCQFCMTDSCGGYLTDMQSTTYIEIRPLHPLKPN